MSAQEAYDAANQAYQRSWQNAVPVRGQYNDSLRLMERDAPEDVEGCLPFVERFIATRAALRAADAATKALLAEREAAYKVLVATGG